MIVRKKIVTYMTRSIGGHPQGLLEGGTRTITLPDPYRVFAIKRVAYDSGMTPLYIMPILSEKEYTDLEELKKDHPRSIEVIDGLILDKDKSLQVYEP